jgi:hypothetical protein
MKRKQKSNQTYKDKSIVKLGVMSPCNRNSLSLFKQLFNHAGSLFGWLGKLAVNYANDY